MTNTLTIRQAAEAAVLSADTIRYYEKIGVLPQVPRSANGYRRYPSEHVETLRFARSLRDLGLPPGSMTALIQLFHDGTCQEMRDALVENCEAALAKVHSQRVELERVEAQISRVLSGLNHQPVDDRRISTVDPCVCVTVVEARANPNV